MEIENRTIITAYDGSQDRWMRYEKLNGRIVAMNFMHGCEDERNEFDEMYPGNDELLLMLYKTIRGQLTQGSSMADYIAMAIDLKMQVHIHQDT